jgi:hypothetical protein
MVHARSSIPAVVEAVRASPKLSKASVEQLLGVKLVTLPGNDAFNLYKGGAGKLDGMAVTAVDFREPKAGGGATAGPLLNLKVAGKCLKRADLEAKYGKMKLTGSPRGRSLDEESSWSLIEPWGRLSFGFAERNPDCLSSVTFAIGERG